MKIIPVLLFALLLSASHTAAQHRWFTPDELQGNAAIALARDPSGALWAIVSNPAHHPTPFAVQRFDGTAWTTVSTPSHDYPLPQTARLWDIAADHAGNILIAAERYLLRFDQSAQRWSRFQFDDSLKQERNFHHILVDAYDRIWISAASRKVLQRTMIAGAEVTSVIPYMEMFRFDDGRLRCVLSWGDAGFRFTNPAEDSKGNIWVAYQRRDETAPGGLVKFNGDSSAVVDIPKGSSATSGPMIRCLYIDRHDQIHIGSSYQVDRHGRAFPPTVARISSDFTTYSERIFPSKIFGYHELTTLMEHKGEMYAGTEGGLFKFIGDTVRIVEFRRYFPAFAAESYLNTVHGIVPAGDSLYCATSWGIVMLDSVTALSGVKVMAKGSLHGTAVPNPVRGSGGITIEMKLAENDAIGEILLLNSSGKRADVAMTKLSDASIRLETAELSAGAYFARIRTTGGEEQMIRFVVER